MYIKLFKNDYKWLFCIIEMIIRDYLNELTAGMSVIVD